MNTCSNFCVTWIPGWLIKALLVMALVGILYRHRKPLFYWHYTPPGEK